MPLETRWRDALAPADPEKIRVLTQAAGVFSATEIGWSHDLAMEARDRGPASGYRFLLAEQQGALVGYACFGPIEGTAGRFDLYWIVVHPQGQGLGTALLSRTIHAALEAGATHLFIETSSRPDYAAAHRLYRSVNFTLMGTLTDFYSDGDSKLIFGKRIA